MIRFVPFLGIILGGVSEWLGFGRHARRDRINTQGSRL